MALPTITFEITQHQGRCELTVDIVANQLFDTSLSQRWSFSSKIAMRRRLERIKNRISNPRRALASVPWPRCFPPYSRAQREKSFFIGSLRVYRKGEYLLSHTLAISTSFGAHPIICQGRGDYLESQFMLPLDFFDKVLATLDHKDKSFGD
jgi:hypothetical protein